MGVGEALSAAREASGQTVEDVSRATRIRGELLRRIEADDFAGCGGNVYARGHVRAIATHLGLDPAPLVQEFDRAHADEAEAPAAREIFEHEVLAMPERTGPNWTAAMAAAAGVLLIVALVSLFNTNPAANEPLANPRTSVTPTPAGTTPSSAVETPDSIAGQVPGDTVSVRIRIVGGRSWVGVKADGKDVFGKTLDAGSVQDFTAKRTIALVLGNAGAVRLVVNGQDLGTPGTTGQVLKLNFTPDDPTSAG